MEVRAEQITKEFLRKRNGTNVFTAVKPLDLSLPAGSLTVIRGRSGGGKSTLLTMLSGLLKPTAGAVYYDDTDIYAMPDEALSEFRYRHVGFVPQGKSAISSLNVLENILLPAMLYKKDREKEAKQLMEQFGIAELWNVMPEELSGGELRRMAIARALLNKPEILFADEPTGDLDDENTRIVFQTFKEIAENGTTVVMVTHEGDAETYADRVYRMDAGELNETRKS